MSDSEHDSLRHSITEATSEAELLEIAERLGIDLVDDGIAEATGRPVDRFVVGTLAEVATFFGRALQTVKQWRTESPPMPGSPGAYDLAEVSRWVLARAERRSTEEVSEKRELEKQKLRLELQAKQLKLDTDRSRLVERDSVLAENRKAFARVRVRLEAIPEELASSLPPEIAGDVVADLKHKIHLALKELAGR